MASTIFLVAHFVVGIAKRAFLSIRHDTETARIQVLIP
jgi:hypothetical protein